MVLSFHGFIDPNLDNCGINLAFFVDNLPFRKIRLNDYLNTSSPLIYYFEDSIFSGSAYQIYVPMVAV